MYHCNLMFSKYKFTIFAPLFSNLSFLHGLKCGLYHTVPLHDLKIHKNVHSPWASSSIPTQVSFSSVKICSGLFRCVHACWVLMRTHLGLSFWVEFLKQSLSFLSFPFSIGDLDWDQSASADFSFISQAGESVRIWNGLFKGADLMIENWHVKTKRGSWPL